MFFSYLLLVLEMDEMSLPKIGSLLSVGPTLYRITEVDLDGSFRAIRYRDWIEQSYDGGLEVFIERFPDLRDELMEVYED